MSFDITSAVKHTVASAYSQKLEASPTSGVNLTKIQHDREAGIKTTRFVSATAACLLAQILPISLQH